MKRFLTLIAVFLLAALGSNVFAQKNRPDDYNLRKAYEVLKENNDRDEALKLLGKQLELTPDNVEALMLRMRIYRQLDEPGNQGKQAESYRDRELHALLVEGICLSGPERQGKSCCYIENSLSVGTEGQS